jgi:hypothetical protein
MIGSEMTHAIIVIKQRSWTKQELKREGFAYYERRKELVMARELPASEAPKEIKSSCDEPLIVEAGYMICYSPNEDLHHTLDAYEQWPVEPEIFGDTYSSWDESLDDLSHTAKQLMDLGCRPYYKSKGVWAKQADAECYIQSLESEKPLQVEPGWMVVIGADGEPYCMTEDEFLSRYERA